MKMRRMVSLVLAFSLMLALLPGSQGAGLAPRAAEEKPLTTLYIDYMGSGNAPQGTRQPLPQFTGQDVTNQTVIWLGVGVEHLEALDLATSGLFNLEIAFDYDPQYLAPCGVNGNVSKEAWLAAISNANFEAGAPVDDPLYWDSANYGIAPNEAVQSTAMDQTAGRELPAAVELPSNWDQWKMTYINLRKTNNTEDAASSRFCGETATARKYLIRLPFLLKGVPSSSVAKVPAAVKFSLGPNTFVMGSGANGLALYGEWRASDSVIDDPEINLKNKMTFDGDLDLFTPSGGTLTGLTLTGFKVNEDNTDVPLSPVFSQATQEYTAEIPRGKGELWVTPKIDQTTITTVESVALVRGETTSNFDGSGTGPYKKPVESLQEGDRIEIRVKAQDGTIVTYQITLKEPSALSGLEVAARQAGEEDVILALDPEYDPGTTDYDVTVPMDKEKLAVKPKPGMGATLQNVQRVRKTAGEADDIKELNGSLNSGFEENISELKNLDVIRITIQDKDANILYYNITISLSENAGVGWITGQAKTLSIDPTRQRVTVWVIKSKAMDDAEFAEGDIVAWQNWRNKISGNDYKKFETTAQGINNDGTFTVEVDPGVYDVVIECIAYLDYIIRDVAVTEGLETRCKTEIIKLIAGDTNKDGKVDGEDYATVVELNGKSVSQGNPLESFKKADFNKDEKIDGEDYANVVESNGKGQPIEIWTPSPES